MGLAVAGVDLLRAKRGPVVMEVNSSPGLEGIENTTGVDVAGEIIEYIEDHAHSVTDGNAYSGGPAHVAAQPPDDPAPLDEEE